MAGPFPENGTPDAFSQTIQATCDTNAYSGCSAIDPNALNFLLQMVARLANIAPNNDNPLNCSTPETLLTNVKKYIDDTAAAISQNIENADIPCLTTDLGGTVPAGPQPNIWYDDRAGQKKIYLWDCTENAYRTIQESADFDMCGLPDLTDADLTTDDLVPVCNNGTGGLASLSQIKGLIHTLDLCTLQAFDPATDTLADTDKVIVCNSGSAKQINVSDLRASIGSGTAGLVYSMNGYGIFADIFTGITINTKYTSSIKYNLNFKQYPNTRAVLRGTMIQNNNLAVSVGIGSTYLDATGSGTISIYGNSTYTNIPSLFEVFLLG